jgi:hypothetical protein
VLAYKGPGCLPKDDRGIVDQIEKTASAVVCGAFCVLTDLQATVRASSRKQLPSRVYPS